LSNAAGKAATTKREAYKDIKEAGNQSLRNFDTPNNKSEEDLHSVKMLRTLTSTQP
jgi:hypothetical protein